MRTIIFILLCALSIGAGAQNVNTNDTLQLKEVEVIGSRVVDRTDGRSYLPSDAQRRNATSGWAILSKMALPGIRIDELAQTATAMDNRGAVQLRLNGTIATKADLQSLDPKTVVRVDFIDRPGVRYGDDIGYVIDVRTRRATGYSVGTHLRNSLTSVEGSNDVFASWNTGRSQLGLSYQNTYSDLRGSLTTDQAQYRMADGSTRTIVRQDTETRSRSFGNNIELKYNLADSLYIFQTVLSLQTSNTPGNYTRGIWSESQPSTPLPTGEGSGERLLLPTLDLYLFRQLTTRQSITLSTTGTLIQTNADYTQDEGTPYLYNVKGRTYSLQGEAVYENRLQPFTLSAGLNWNWKYTHNQYTGDSEADNRLHKSGIYGFAQVAGQLQRLSYTLGLGLSNQRYSQASHSYSHWLWRPKASLQYRLGKHLSLSYDFELSQHVSAYAMTSDAAVRQNSLEWKVGNPAITPNSCEKHWLGLVFNRPRFYSSLSYEYRWNRRCNMDRYERTDEGLFLQSQTNQRGVGLWYISNYTQWEVLSRSRLVLSVQGGYYRFFSSGDAYANTHESFNGSLALQSELGRWSLALSADNGWSFVEGTHGMHNVLTVGTSATYRFGRCSVGLTLINPFMAHPKDQEYFITHPLVSKTTTLRSTDQGNSLRLTFAWRLSGGQKYRAIQRKQNRKDTDGGILK